MKFSIAQETRLGHRSNNEDRLAYSHLGDEVLMMVVADGMGGHADGQVAAQYVVQVLTEAFSRYAKSRIEDPFLFFHTYIQYAHELILRHVETYKMEDAPRTTVVACLVQDNIAYWAHAGDSRLYVLRGGKIYAQTRDHSVVRQLLDSGAITSVQLATHPDHNKVYNCLGGKIAPNIEFSRKTTLQAKDTIILCSDGFWVHMSDPYFVKRLSEHPPPDVLPHLVDEAVRRNGRGGDNTSAIVARWADNYTELADSMQASMGSVQSQFLSSKNPSKKPLTDEEIDQAISDIRKSINKPSS